MTGVIRRCVREPLLHFVSMGLLLFIASQIHRAYTDPFRIIVTPQREAQLARHYALQFGTKPDTATTAQLIEHDVEEEILFRRGLALGLDKDDEIVRRRIVQKMRFLLQDLQAPPEPRDADLDAYYQAHAERYVTPPRVTFSHIYFSDEARALRAGSADRGDPFPDLNHFSAYDPQQVQRLFGRTEFSQAVFRAPLQRWVGPYRSAYGWHLLRVDSREEATQQPLSAVHDRVRTDYLLDEQQRANQAAFNDVAREFTVVHTKS